MISTQQFYTMCSKQTRHADTTIRSMYSSDARASLTGVSMVWARWPSATADAYHAYVCGILLLGSRFLRQSH